MKYLLLLTVLILSSCVNFQKDNYYNVGECIVRADKAETFDPPNTTHKIIEIGMNKYLMAFEASVGGHKKVLEISEYKSFFTIGYKLTECTGLLKGYKK